MSDDKVLKSGSGEGLLHVKSGDGEVLVVMDAPSPYAENERVRLNARLPTPDAVAELVLSLVKATRAAFGADAATVRLVSAPGMNAPPPPPNSEPN